MKNSSEIQKKSILNGQGDSILLRCIYCGMYFEFNKADINHSSILGLFCPNCGLVIDYPIVNNKYGYLDNSSSILHRTFEKVYFSCCNKNIKVELVLKIIGCYCPFCGVKEYEVE